MRKGLILEKGSWGSIRDNGFSANFVFEKHKSIRPEFKSYSEIEAIYPYSLGKVYTPSKKQVYDGIQIETKDLKVCIFNSTIHPLKDIMPHLISELGPRWEKVYMKDKQLDRKHIGIHHWNLKGDNK